MKKIIIVSLTVFIAYGDLFSQALPQQPVVEKTYLDKSKKQKKTGRVLLIGGGAAIASSLIVPRGKKTYDGICIGPWCDDEYKNDGIKSALFVAGALSALGSIPFSLASSKNKKRARNAVVLIDVDKISGPNALLVNNHAFPVLGLKVSL
jgi:hypothetical protein